MVGEQWQRNTRAISVTGMGLDVGIEGKDVIGASLVIDDHPIHMELFRRTAPRQAAVSGQ